jgi:hypothetical protein
MTEFIIGVVAGVIVGWNVTQPEWAKNAQAKVIETAVSLKEKIMSKFKKD